MFASVNPVFAVTILLLLLNAVFLFGVWKQLAGLNRRVASNPDEFIKLFLKQQERLSRIDEALDKLWTLCGRLEKDLKTLRQTSVVDSVSGREQERGGISAVRAGPATEVEKKTAIYNRVRKRELRETVLPFKRVKMEFLDGSRLEDLAREPLLEEHTSGDGVIIKSADDQLLLFPYFRKKRLGEKLRPYFSGEDEFHEVVAPAICNKVTDKSYEVTRKGIIE